MAKDRWDKAEVISKIGGAILIPVLLGVWGVIWNSRFEVEQAVTGRIELAIAILSAQPIGDGSDASIRKWAISVLQSPIDPPEFPDRGELLQGYIAQDSAICAELKGVIDEVSQAILMNSEATPAEVINSVAQLVRGFDVGCGDDGVSKADHSE